MRELLVLENGSQLIEVDGYRMHCVVLGSGPPLLVVHGGMGYGHRGFRPWLDDLAERRTLIYVDLPGNGGSDTPADYEQWNTVERLAESLHQLRVGLGLESWSVLGHSFGGYVVQSYALDYPEEIDALVISCSTSIMDHMDASLEHARIASHSEEQYQAIAAALFTPKASDAEFDLVTSQVRSAYFADPDFLGRDVQMPTGGSAAAFNATLRVWDHSDLSDRVASISVPTLVLGAARDWTFPLEVGARRTHRMIEGSSYHEFANSGHFPYVEEHDEFVAVVADWLSSAG